MSIPGSAPVIAIDGPSGSGKSTVARGVATRLGWGYLDTGAVYRAATLAVLESGTDLVDAPAVVDVVRGLHLEVSTDPGAPCVRLAGVDVTAEIRGPAVTASVSAVSAVPAVRDLLVRLQRDAIAGGPCVVEGRDIGTAVAPNAIVKVFLDADPGVRAQRRAAEPVPGVAPAGSAPGAIVAAVATDLARRDQLDSSRAASPLRPADDAVRLDATELTAAEVIERVLRLAADAGVVLPERA